MLDEWYKIEFLILYKDCSSIVYSDAQLHLSVSLTLFYEAALVAFLKKKKKNYKIYKYWYLYVLSIVGGNKNKVAFTISMGDWITVAGVFFGGGLCELLDS